MRAFVPKEKYGNFKFPEKVYVDDGRVLFERMFKGLDVEMVNFTVEMM